MGFTLLYFYPPMKSNLMPHKIHRTGTRIRTLSTDVEFTMSEADDSEDTTTIPFSHRVRIPIFTPGYRTTITKWLRSIILRLAFPTHNPEIIPHQQQQVGWFFFNGTAGDRPHVVPRVKVCLLYVVTRLSLSHIFPASFVEYLYHPRLRNRLYIYI